MKPREYPTADLDELIQVIENRQGYLNRGVDAVKLLEKYQREILIPAIKDSPYFDLQLFNYGARFLFEAGCIHGIRIERSRRKTKVQRRNCNA